MFKELDFINDKIKLLTGNKFFHFISIYSEQKIIHDFLKHSTIFLRDYFSREFSLLSSECKRKKKKIFL